MLITSLIRKCHYYALKYDNWSQLISGLSSKKHNVTKVQKQSWEIGC